jgi:hypothetical protein
MALAALMAIGCASQQAEIREQERQQAEAQTDAWCAAPPDDQAAGWCNQRDREKDRALMRELVQTEKDEHQAAERERRRQRAQDVWRASQAPYQRAP